MHGAVCPCPNCRGSGGWGWLVVLAVAVAVAIGCYFAVHAAVAWLAGHVVFDVLAVWLLGFGGFGVAWKARERARRGLPNSARAIFQVPPAAEGRSEPHIHVPEPRRGQ